jgi:hypothetical protein
MAGERTVPGPTDLTAFWNLSSNGWKPGMDTNLQTLGAMVQCRVLSRVTALPGSPTDGQIYIVPSGGDANKIALRDNGAWVYIVPWEGCQAYVVDDNEFIWFDGTDWLTFTGTGIPDAPVDATLYGRQDGAWEPIPDAIDEAPNDGGQYVRQSEAWVEVFIPPEGIVMDTHTADYVLDIDDANTYVRMSSGSPLKITVPPNSSVAFPVGTQIIARQVGAGQLEIEEGSGVTITTAETLLARKAGSSLTLIKVATDTWDLTGDLELL